MREYYHTIEKSDRRKAEFEKIVHMKRQIHPNSLANLTREGRALVYGEPKKNRKLTVTETGWEGAQAVVQALGCTSLSDFLEQMGRGKIRVEIESES